MAMSSRLGRRLSSSNPLPEGTASVGVGLLVLGVTSYGFLVVTGRVLGPGRYASLSALWALVFLAGPGFFLPLEQETSRLMANRRSLGVGHGDVLRKAAVAGGILVALLICASFASASPLLQRVFDRQVLLLAALQLSLVAYFAEFLFRGGLCVFLVAVGVRTSGPYGLALALSPLAATGVGLFRRRMPLRAPGRAASWTDFSTALGYLLAASVLAQVLLNAAPLTVKILATKAEAPVAGRFLAGLVLARVPLFLFQAVQAALLPKLAALAGEGQHQAFRSGMRSLILIIAGIGVLATVGALAVGPLVVRTFFGSGFTLTRRDLGLLAAGSGAYMLAALLSQALIALSLHRRLLAPWCCGIVLFCVAVGLSRDLLFRAEIGLLVGAAGAAVLMGGGLFAGIRSLSVVETTDEGLREIGHVILEP